MLVERSGEGGGDAECRGWAIRASLTYTDVAFDLHFRVAERREGGRRGELRAAFCQWSSRRRSDPAMGAGRRGDLVSTRRIALHLKEGEAGGPGRDRRRQKECFLVPQCPCVVVSGFDKAEADANKGGDGSDFGK